MILGLSYKQIGAVAIVAVLVTLAAGATRSKTR